MPTLLTMQLTAQYSETEKTGLQSFLGASIHTMMYKTCDIGYIGTSFQEHIKMCLLLQFRLCEATILFLD